MNLTGFRVDDAQDLLQMTIERLLRRGWNPDGVAHPTAYAKKTMENVLLSLQARLSSQLEVPVLHGSGDGGSGRTGPAVPAADDPADQVADHDMVIRALQCLTKRRRLILVLRFGEDLTYPQIAQRLGCAVSTVRTEATRALRQISGAAGAPGPTDKAES
jgi:RNA polymerase sigma factor (sigma-70 family)